MKKWYIAFLTAFLTIASALSVLADTTQWH